jgi:hypothetical protein
MTNETVGAGAWLDKSIRLWHENNNSMQNAFSRGIPVRD